ncbi:hypothetical protein ACN28S_04560 [Cystobacter fuscus]
MRKLAAKSNTLWKDLSKLEKEGWSIEYGPHVSGNYTAEAERKVYLRNYPDSHFRDSNARLHFETSLLAHEVSHALDAMQGKRQKWPHVPLVGVGQGQRSNDFVQVNYDNAMRREADAVIKQIQTRSEILRSGGPDIGVPGKQGSQYQAIMDTSSGVDDAREKIAKLYANETPSIGNVATYREYYYSHYAKQWNDYAAKWAPRV